MTPGSLTWDLRAGEALWLLEPGEARAMSMLALDEETARLRQSETTRRSRFLTPLHRAADAYVVRRGRGCTIVAGYPWFTDWGRDTFVALRGLCFATGRHDQGRDILLEWARTVSEGMLPNRFPDAGDSPELQRRRCVPLVCHRRARSLPGGRTRRDSAAGETQGVAAQGGRSDSRRLHPRHPIWHPRRRRRAAGLRGARRAADVDGCADRRPRHHAANRQARRSAGALGQRPGVWRSRRCEMASGVPGAPRQRSPRGSGTRHAAVSTTSWMWTMCQGAWTTRCGRTRSTRWAGWARR